jgi:hypothetical protein
LIHLSARLAWHDTGWNGCVCREPHLNASCIVQEQIRDGRDDELERAHAGVPLADLPGWLPPCCRDTAAYSNRSFTFVHNDPLDRSFLKPITEEIPPYACLPAPYRWMLEASFRDICEAEGLTIRGPTNPEKETGWVYEPDRQVALLNHFWGRLKEGEGEALIHRTSSGVLVRSKSEVIVANALDKLGNISWKYEEPLFPLDAPRDYRLPDFTIGFEGDVYYWEHLGMLSVPAYREGWERKRRWYEERMGIPVVGDGARPGFDVEPGVSPLVITSRDGDDGSIDQQRIEVLARKYVLLEEY